MLGFPSLGVWGALLVRGGWAPGWGVSPAGLLVHALGEYLDPAGDRDRNGPHMGVLNNFRGPFSWLVGTRGSRVTWRLAVQFKMC